MNVCAASPLRILVSTFIIGSDPFGDQTAKNALRHRLPVCVVCSKRTHSVKRNQTYNFTGIYSRYLARRTSKQTGRWFMCRLYVDEAEFFFERICI